VGEGLGRDDVEIVLALVRGLEVWGTRARGGASAAYWEMGQAQPEAEGCKGVGLVLLCLLRALTRAIAARGVGGGVASQVQCLGWRWGADRLTST